jgi:prepilin-type N-terminal cleavage/methylation domain-containing protein
MKAVPGIRARRSAFTLIELLVVIAIIVVIIGLLLSAVIQLLSWQDVIQNRKDVDDLNKAVEDFKTKYNVYPPSYIVLSNDPKQYDPNNPLGLPAQQYQLNQDSAKYLRQIWPKLDLTQSIDWSGGNMPAIFGNQPWTVTLEGDQCLVFFLGGLQSLSPPGTLGWANDSQNPTRLTLANKVAPFFNFLASRLYQRSPNHTFLSYKDVYGSQPIAYFSIRNSTKNLYMEGDCASLQVYPYYSIKNATGGIKLQQFLNPDRFQIISAGRDMSYGAATGPAAPGNHPQGSWDPINPSVSAQANDNISNFSGSALGQPQS